MSKKGFFSFQNYIIFQITAGLSVVIIHMYTQGIKNHGHKNVCSRIATHLKCKNAERFLLGLGYSIYN